MIKCTHGFLSPLLSLSLYSLGVLLLLLLLYDDYYLRRGWPLRIGRAEGEKKTSQKEDGRQEIPERIV